jgi:hypothetical protein
MRNAGPQHDDSADFVTQKFATSFSPSVPRGRQGETLTTYLRLGDYQR